MTMDITYYAECDTDYVKAVKACKTLKELKAIVKKYREFAEDAYTVVKKMDDVQFKQFCNSRNRFKPSITWMEKYGAILLPERILLIGIVATEFHVPFGAAYHRLKDLGMLEGDKLHDQFKVVDV